MQPSFDRLARDLNPEAPVGLEQAAAVENRQNADVLWPELVRPQDQPVFRIGSITKTFTAVAVMQLWEQGLVDLDAPANDYLRHIDWSPGSRIGGPRRCGICLPTRPGCRSGCTHGACSTAAGSGRPSRWTSACLPWRSTTAAACAWQWSRARPGPTPITGSRRSARSWRTSLASPWTAT